MRTARWWKSFYAEERSRLDVDQLLRAASAITLPEKGALVFPHTLLSVSGPMVASVALAAARTGRNVLALGVLHGAREGDQEEVRKARAGDPHARQQLRGIHADGGYAAEEFSLDGFRQLYERACAQEGGRARLTARFPFLVGERPTDLPGLGDLARLARDSVVVATTDPIHHGIGYGTPEPKDASLPETKIFAHARIEEQLSALARADFSLFAQLCTRDSSDFRDLGPVLALLFPKASWKLKELLLVDYSETLASKKPTWVAAGRIHVEVGPPAPLLPP